MQPLVSVIVCVYNAQDTICRCVDSVLGQSLSDFELIIIDDGSIDGTKSIVDSFADSDRRVVVVHQSNQGISIARQNGIQRANGLYSLFVDADDWIEPYMLEVLTNNAKNTGADIVFCDFFEENENGVFYWKQKPASEDSSVVLEQMLIQLHGTLWNKLIRKDLYTRTGTEFVKGLNFCEDEYIIIRLLSYGCKVSYVGLALYHYDKNANVSSYTNQWNSRTADEYELFIQSCVPYLKTPQLKQILNERIAGIIKKLTHAPADRYSENKAFFYRHKTSLWHSKMSLSRKIYCWLFYNGFRWIKKFGNVHID